MKQDVIYANCKIPQPREHYLSRFILYEQLEQAKKYPVLLLQGGAGSGKTTLVSSYIKDCTLQHCAWISLDESCDQLFLFWNYMFYAIDEMTSHSFPLLHLRKVQQKEDLYRFMIETLNELETSQEAYLILDDIQKLQDAEVLKSLHFFLAHLPSSIHIWLLTRTQSSLYLADLLAKNQVFCIWKDQLWFHKEEELAFLKDTCGLTSGDQALLHMCDLARGWIGGLQLIAAACYGKRDDEIHTQNFSSTLLYEYIQQEILSTLTETEQQFLIFTSPMHYFSLELLQKLFDSSVEETFYTICKRNFLILTIDENAQLYRYHDILRQFLLTQFSRYPKEKQLEIETKIAFLFLAAKDEKEALQHFLHVKNYEMAMQILIERKAHGLMIAYMEQIPLQEICKNPDFAYQYFFYHYINADNETCEQVYQMIAQNLKDDQGYCAFRFADLFIHADFCHHDIQVSPLQQTLQLSLSKETISFLLTKDAFFLYVQNRYEEAFQYLNQVKRLYEETNHPFTGFILFMTLTQIYEEKGEYQRCLSIYQQEQSLLKELKTMASSYYLGIAGVYLKLLKQKECKEALDFCKCYLMQETGTYLLSIQKGYAHTSALYMLVFEDPHLGMQQLWEILQGCKKSDYLYYAPLWMLYHKNTKDMSWAADYLEAYEHEQMYPQHFDCHFLAILLLIDYQQKNMAYERLQKLLSKARELHNLYAIVMGDLIKTVNFYEEYERGCIHALIEAVTYAYQQQVAYPFWFHQASLSELKQRWKKELKQKLELYEWDFFNKILKPKESLLTQREQEVMKEMVGGRKNQEIADELGISLATVKTHILNIYSKLQIKSRAEAVNWYHDHS